MRIALFAVVVLALIVAPPLIIEGIRTNDPGFWLWVAIVLIGGYKLYRHTQKGRSDETKPRPLISSEDVPNDHRSRR